MNLTGVQRFVARPVLWPPVMAQIGGALLVLLCGSACTDEPPAVSKVRTPGDNARANVTVEVSPGDDPDVCELLPQDCGPCAVACDHDALAAFIPPGTCAAFICELVDGREAIFHTCHPE